MCRSNFKLFSFVVGMLAGLWPCLALAEIRQETMGADGFPSSWKPTDFAVGAEIISAATPPVVRVGASVTMVISPSTAMSVDGVGILKLGTGGEAPDLWLKAQRGEAEDGLQKAVAQGVASPALKEAWRTVLLTEAPPPQVQDKGIRPSWLRVRSDALQKMGLYEAAFGLWAQVPQQALANDSVAEGWVKSKILAGEAREGCAVAKSRTLAVGSNAGEWPVIMAVCQLVAPLEANGNPAAAKLSLQLVEPTLRSRNPSLFRVLTAVQDGKPVTNLAGPTTVDALGGGVLAAFPALVGPELMERLPDVALRRLVGSGALPVDVRGRAAIALARQTGLPADGATAWKLVSETTFTGVLPDAVLLAQGTKGISGTEAGAYVQAALRLGMLDAAAKAMPLWNDTGKGKVQAQVVLGMLQGKVDDQVWDAWMVVQDLTVQGNVRQAQRTLLAAEGLGIGVPSRVWGQMRDRAVPVSTLVDPAWQRVLAKAVADGNIPGSLGLISEALAGQPPAGAVPVVVGATVEALRKAGFEDVAKRFAAEAVLGIPASHLIALVEEAPVPVSATQILIGADTVPQVVLSPTVISTTASAVSDGMLLPPPRAMPIAKPKAPTKPVMPKAGR